MDSKTGEKIKDNTTPHKGDPDSTETLYNPDETPKSKTWYYDKGDAYYDKHYNQCGNWGNKIHDHIYNPNGKPPH